jgi:hypothetical protein
MAEAARHQARQPRRLCRPTTTTNKWLLSSGASRIQEPAGLLSAGRPLGGDRQKSGAIIIIITTIIIIVIIIIVGRRRRRAHGGGLDKIGPAMSGEGTNFRLLAGRSRRACRVVVVVVVVWTVVLEVIVPAGHRLQRIIQAGERDEREPFVGPSVAAAASLREPLPPPPPATITTTTAPFNWPTSMLNGA